MIIAAIFLTIWSLIIISRNSKRTRTGGCNVKPPCNTPRPNVQPAPQNPKVTP